MSVGENTDSPVHAGDSSSTSAQGAWLILAELATHEPEAIDWQFLQVLVDSILPFPQCFEACFS